ncbi:MAG: AbrB/MazE/SpoVT family DNA-binding domain-containing protein [Candidatus Woesearchaeota archaeon]|nr:AbrB/MazE/SpoVT family DNA-binding domain-containing protein [Candidatus Woesearchaeota archaeon]
MNVDITRISSKGQVVIPQEMRAQFTQGEKLLIIEENGQLILKSTKHLRKNLEEDIKFAHRTEQAWKRYDEGEFIEMELDEFLEEAKQW